MATYILISRLTDEGCATLTKNPDRIKEVNADVEAMGGKVEALYYAFGQTDLFIVVDLPDNVTAAAVSMIGEATGVSEISVTVLITPEEIDRAAQIAQKMGASYRVPER